MLGFSMGLVAALRCAIKSPERVEKLVLVSAMVAELPGITAPTLIRVYGDYGDYRDYGDYAGLIFIPCGTLNEAPIKQVDHHVRVDAKAAWVEIRDDLPQFPGMQPPRALGVK